MFGSQLHETDGQSAARTSMSIGRKYTVHNDTSHLQPGRGDPGLK